MEFKKKRLVIEQLNEEEETIVNRFNAKCVGSGRKMKQVLLGLMNWFTYNGRIPNDQK